MVNPILIGAGIAGLTAAGDWLYSVYDPTKVASIKLRTEEGKLKPVSKTPTKKYGLIVLGDDGNRLLKKSFENTSALVYRTLRERGYQQDNLFVLEGKKHPTERFDCHTLPSSKKHLREVLGHLYKNVTSDDIFFMYVLSHGDKTGLILPIGQSTFSLYPGKVKEIELEELLSDLHPNYSVTYFNTCYSGGFALRLGRGRNIAISTSRRDKMTSGYVGPKVLERQGRYASNFTLNFFSALRRKLPNGDRIDINDDSIDGLFDFASERSHQDDRYFGPFSKNTPHLVYGQINPKEAKL